MGKVLAGMTISVDGFITGPWSYDSPERREPAGADRAWLEETMGASGRGPSPFAAFTGYCVKSEGGESGWPS
jgi:hypothetical protein